MTALNEDPWISTQVVDHAVAELVDCAIAVDATYFLLLHIDVTGHEPLLPALGGLTGIHARIEQELQQWKDHNVTPFFIFDGQPITGQDEVTVMRSKELHKRTNEAWTLYDNGKAVDAVSAFGQNTSIFRPQALYPLLQSILKERNLHFLVAPFTAAAQIAYFDMVDSDQVAGIMGSFELMLYPINDSIIRSIDWDNKTVQAVSKKHILKALNVSESLFIDGFLMTGTSFLPPFPALLDPSINRNSAHTISDALNMLRTSEKSVTMTCTTFHDVLKKQDPDWLDKYRKARMAVDHFIYIAESGEVKVHDPDHLTKDSHEYLGLQLPAELFHYLNVGLIGPRILSWITHSQLYVLPTVDGVASDEYKKVVTTELARIREAALGLVVPRLNRGIGFKNITMKVWYDHSHTQTVWNGHESNKGSLAKQVISWNIKEQAIKEHFPQFAYGSIASEVLALQKPGFAASTLSEPSQKLKGVKSADLIKSICIWRWLHLRGYVDDQHQLTPWGTALAVAMVALEPTVTKYSSVPNLYEALVVAFELLRFELLSAKNKHEELKGLPMQGSDDDKASLLLISRCATLLKLRHESCGYTGPLSKNLLTFRSLASEVRAADRDLVEAIVANMFMHAQAERQRSDNWELSHDLPFLYDPDVALGIAVKTYLDDITGDFTPEQKAERLDKFPKQYVPYALAFAEDLDIACHFFDAIFAGIKTLDGYGQISAVDRAAWEKASKYLELRR